MSNLSYELIDDFMHIRLTAGTTNLLTTDLLVELSNAITDVDANNDEDDDGDRDGEGAAPHM